jgi:hypothetical protein
VPFMELNDGFLLAGRAPTAIIKNGEEVRCFLWSGMTLVSRKSSWEE